MNSKAYYSLVPGLISIFLETVWVPLKIAVYYVADAMTVTSLQCEINQHNVWF